MSYRWNKATRHLRLVQPIKRPHQRTANGFKIAAAKHDWSVLIIVQIESRKLWVPKRSTVPADSAYLDGRLI